MWTKISKRGIEMKPDQTSNGFSYEGITFDHQRQSTYEETLIRYANKLFRLITHIDRSYDFQTYGKLEYFNGTDFVKISTFSHDQIVHEINHENKDCDGKIYNHVETTGYRNDVFLEMVEGIISKYEKFMPHEESK